MQISRLLGRPSGYPAGNAAETRAGAGRQFADKRLATEFAVQMATGTTRKVHPTARSRQAQKRGGEFEITSLNTEIAAQLADGHELARIGDALDELATVDPALAQVVDLKFFCGFSFAEIAAMRACSERTVQRDWEKARIYRGNRQPRD